MERKNVDDKLNDKKRKTKGKKRLDDVRGEQSFNKAQLRIKRDHQRPIASNKSRRSQSPRAGQ